MLQLADVRSFPSPVSLLCLVEFLLLSSSFSQSMPSPLKFEFEDALHWSYLYPVLGSLIDLGVPECVPPVGGRGKETHTVLMDDETVEKGTTLDLETQSQEALEEEGVVPGTEDPRKEGGRGARTVEDIASESGVDPDVLYRTLRFLSSQWGVFEENQGKLFRHTSASEEMRKGGALHVLLRSKSKAEAYISFEDLLKNPRERQSNPLDIPHVPIGIRTPAVFMHILECIMKKDGKKHLNVLRASPSTSSREWRRALTTACSEKGVGLTVVDSDSEPRPEGSFFLDLASDVPVEGEEVEGLLRGIGKKMKGRHPLWAVDTLLAESSNEFQGNLEEDMDMCVRFGRGRLSFLEVDAAAAKAGFQAEVVEEVPLEEEGGEMNMGKEFFDVRPRPVGSKTLSLMRFTPR